MDPGDDVGAPGLTVIGSDCVPPAPHVLLAVTVNVPEAAVPEKASVGVAVVPFVMVTPAAGVYVHA